MAIRVYKKLLFIAFLTSFSKVYAGNLDACVQLNDQKLDKCLNAIMRSSTWEPLKGNLKSALKKSKNKINIRFDMALDRAAITKVDVVNNQYRPVIVLGKNTDTNELLITLNHELVHYISTFDRLAYVFKNEKIGKCLTEYQLLTLLDEAEAFKAELVFWNNAPPIFKEHFKNVFFNSKLFQKRMNYQDFYKLLDACIASDKNFILKKYIDIGEYVPCAKNII